MSNEVLVPREQVVFLVEESTPGTLEQPAAGDALQVVGLADVPFQQPTYTPSEEIANSRSVLAYARDSYGPGNWGLSTYLRPAGAAGSAPMEGLLWKGAAGAETIDAGVDVTYGLALALPQASLWWWGNDNLLLFARGCTVNEVRLTVTDRGFLQAEWSGQCKEVGRCGETALNGALVGGEADVPVDDAERFTAGAPVTIGTSTGHTVTAVDYTTGELTVTPVVSGAQLDGAAVVPELPTPTYAGTPAECRNAGLTVGGVATKFKTFELTIRNAVEYIADEVDASAEFPSDFVAGARAVEASATIVLRSDDVGLWRKGEAGATEAAVLTVLPSRTGGTDAGNSITVTLAQALVSVSEVGEGSPAVDATLSIMGRATSAGEDEVSLVFA